MKMTLSLMSFPFQAEALFGLMNAEKLCTVAKQSGMQMLDLTGMIPMQAVLEKLQADGYDGALCVEYAAAAGVHGLEHAKALEAYTKTIRTYWEREDDKR